MRDPHVLDRWLELEWSDLRADYRYVLKQRYAMPPISLEVVTSKGFLGLGGYETTTESTPIDPVVSTVVSGDLNWAKATSKHYGIDLPQQEAAA